jgi:sugar lactone lactonase YvrE
MTSSHRRLAITLAFLGLAVAPATIGAQPPTYLTQWGSEGSGNGQFFYPVGVAADAVGGIYVVDYGNSRIQKFSSTGTYLTQWGSIGSGDGQFASPFGIATDVAGNVYVSELDNRRIQKFTATGVYLTQWGAPPDSTGQAFVTPYAVATDPAGDVFVVDGGNQKILKFTNTGIPITEWGSGGSGSGQFDFPIGAATDAAGNVYVVEFANNRVQKFTNTGVYLTQWGSFGSGDGQFANPAGIATDPAGNVYVADFGNNRIQMFTGTGTYLTQWGSFGSGNGEFSTPRGVATDASGNIYVADQGNQRIQKFGPATPPPPTCTVTVAFDLKPNTLNLRSMGHWVTGRIEPPAPFAPGDIDVASIRLNGTVPVDPAAPVSVNGSALTVKFDRSAVQAAVVPGDSVPVEATGDIGTDCFSSVDRVRTIQTPVTAPTANWHIASGQATPIRWETPPHCAPLWVAVLSSFDDGQSWNLEAQHLPNTGTYDWQAPYANAANARIAVVLVERELTDDDVDGVLGIGPRFSIGNVSGVVPVGATFALYGAAPNPARGTLRLSFALPDARPATIALYDLAGRRVWSKDVSALGPGKHLIEARESATLPTGVYLVRISRPGEQLEKRVVLFR